MLFSPDYFVQIINQHLPEPHASLLAGMVFGQKYSRLPADLYAALVRTGTLHVVALSGTNVTILIRLIEKLLWPAGRKGAAVATLSAIGGLVVFVGAEPPIVRAAIMGGIATVGDFAGRRQYGLLSLLFAGGVMLLARPEWLYSLSFQLSFLATLGIIVFDSRGSAFRQPAAVASQPPSTSGAGRFNRWQRVLIELRLTLLEAWEKGKRTFVENLRTTLAAQVFITPLLVYNFGRLSLVAPLANALALWSVEFITPLGIFLVVGGSIWWPVGRVIAWASWFFLQYFIVMVELTGKIPFAEFLFS